MVHHGTNTDFDAFDLKFANAKTEIKGFFFAVGETGSAGDKPVSGAFGSRNVDAFVKIENPATFDDVTRLAKSGVKTPQLHKALQAEGFDGIYDHKKRIVVAFSPRQIKSASRNSGAFDPESDKITD